MAKMVFVSEKKGVLERTYNRGVPSDVPVVPEDGYYDDKGTHFDYDEAKIRECKANPGIWIWL